jgi:hypothetical protein
MPKSKKKTVTVKQIADAVAEEHGIRKYQAKAIVESVFDELSKQFAENGHMKVPNLGTFNVSITTRSGEARPYFKFAPIGRLRNFLKTMCTDKENAPFLEYILERDAVKLERFETRRLEMLTKIKGWRIESQDRERTRIAQFLSDKLGQDVDKSLIGPEYLTPPRDRNARLPDHRITARELLAKSGVLPLQTEDPHSTPEGNILPASPLDSNSPS